MKCLTIVCYVNNIIIEKTEKKYHENYLFSVLWIFVKKVASPTNSLNVPFFSFTRRALLCFIGKPSAPISKSPFSSVLYLHLITEVAPPVKGNERKGREVGEGTERKISQDKVR